MSSELQIVKGSLADLARQTDTSIAESFVGADVVVIVDTSASMASEDSREGRSRYEVACEELARLQADCPGRIAVISFSHDVRFCPGGIPVYLGENTDLAAALRFAKIADLPGMRFILISDGEPDDETAALSIAASYSSRLDVIYVGPEERPRGRDFLERLARSHGGQAMTADRARELAATVQQLLVLGAG